MYTCAYMYIYMVVMTLTTTTTNNNNNKMEAKEPGSVNLDSPSRLGGDVRRAPLTYIYIYIYILYIHIYIYIYVYHSYIITYLLYIMLSYML